ncbi:hypothetical protein C8Q74DRAFT_475639 [Fomes fomentarius]|nr:hypothetical protein C8Q74DRAFT_475639 [Fomes fomentarius]
MTLSGEAGTAEGYGKHSGRAPRAMLDFIHPRVLFHAKIAETSCLNPPGVYPSPAPPSRGLAPRDASLPSARDEPGREQKDRSSMVARAEASSREGENQSWMGSTGRENGWQRLSDVCRLSLCPALLTTHLARSNRSPSGTFDIPRSDHLLGRPPVSSDSLPFSLPARDMSVRTPQAPVCLPDLSTARRQTSQRRVLYRASV